MATTERRGGGRTPVAAGVDLESLDLERQFLLRSLADLDAEFEAGDIEEDDYRSLSDDYTARTAAVLKAIQAVPSSGPPSRVGGTPGGSARHAATGAGAARVSHVPSRLRPAGLPVPAQAAADGTAPARSSPPGAAGTKTAPAEDRPAVPGEAEPSDPRAAALASRRRWRTTAIVGGIVLFGAVAGWAVWQSTGARQAGQTITGNAQISGTTATTVAGGVDPRLTEAVNDANQGKYLAALQLYSAVLRDDPTQPVALANQGWLEAQIGLTGNRPALVTSGLANIVQAEKADTSYAEPHFFRADVLLNDKDAVDAVTEFRTFLALADPADPNIPVAQGLLQQAIKAAGPDVPAGPFAATTTSSPP